MFASANPSKPCRPLGAAGVGRCAMLHASSFARGWSASEFEKLLTSSSVVADCIGQAPRFQGFVLSRIAADEAEILTVAVDSAARGQGLATTLLGRHLANLARKGAASVLLEVDDANRPALALYRRFGFRQVGRRPAYYAKADGSKGNALILKLEL